MLATEGEGKSWVSVNLENESFTAVRWVDGDLDGEILRGATATIEGGGEGVTTIEPEIEESVERPLCEICIVTWSGEPGRPKTPPVWMGPLPSVPAPTRTAFSGFPLAPRVSMASSSLTPRTEGVPATCKSSA
jgi:hypothetical protein